MKQIAQGLAALGRGPDTELVHMTKGEIAGLQALAQKHGKSLTINPDTGLPEAGILSSILPMAAGFALGPAGFGVMSSAMAGLAVGGVSALASGSLQKGLMAGLGAYGGAGLGESLMGAATSSGTAGTTAAMEGGFGAGATVPVAAPTAAVAPGTTSTADLLARGAAEGARPEFMMPSQAGYYGPSVGAEAGNISAFGPQTATQMADTGTTAAMQGGFGNVSAYPAPALPAPTVVPEPTAMERMERVSSGARNVMASPQAALGFAKANMMPLGAAGISALSGMEQPTSNAPAMSKGMIRPYTFTREKNPSAFQDVAGAPYSSKERRYFNDNYTAGTPYAAPGPEYMAGGGTVEAMSNANALGASTNFPQANIRTGAYASPFQQPISQNIVTGAQDASTDPYTGQMNFADGGSVGGYAYDPATMLYSQVPTTTTPAISSTGEPVILPPTVGGGTRGGMPKDDSAWGNMSPTQRAQFYEANPGLGKFNELAQDAFGMTSLGMLQNAFVPDFVAAERGISRGISPVYGFNVAQNQQAGSNALANAMNAAAGYAGNAFAGADNIGRSAPGSAHGRDGDGVATGGSGGDASGGGDRGTRGGFAYGGLTALAAGGMSNLGGYSDGGQLLRGPGDGVSDDIPAMIGQKQQARLADGEFVVPARIVSELGNGSTEAGARQLYAMMDRVQKARGKSIGKGRVATDTKAHKHLPA